MNNMMFTNATPTIKTLSFEARPQFETTKNMRNFTGEGSPDKYRNDNYKKAKEILDKYARLVIDLACEEIAEENMFPTYENLQELFDNKKANPSKDVIRKNPN